jgi:hypothetical protein
MLGSSDVWQEDYLLICEGDLMMKVTIHVATSSRAYLLRRTVRSMPNEDSRLDRHFAKTT